MSVSLRPKSCSAVARDSGKARIVGLPVACRPSATNGKSRKPAVIVVTNWYFDRRSRVGAGAMSAPTSEPMFLRRPVTMQPKSHSAGWTLIELMTALAVAGVLVGIGVPALGSWIQDQRLTTAATSLVLSLNYARNEAVKRDSALGVAVCASNDRLSCSATNWALGWIVIDVASLTVLNATPALSGSLTLTEASGQTAVTYLGTGTIAPTGLPPPQFTACDSRGPAKGHELEVNSMGRIASASKAGLDVSGLALAAC
jgi:prepilin-type N-terminal cleavage/methylation domain-containing protein